MSLHSLAVLLFSAMHLLSPFPNRPRQGSKLLNSASSPSSVSLPVVPSHPCHPTPLFLPVGMGFPIWDKSSCLSPSGHSSPGPSQPAVREGGEVSGGPRDSPHRGGGASRCDHTRCWHTRRPFPCLPENLTKWRWRVAWLCPSPTPWRVFFFLWRRVKIGAPANSAHPMCVSIVVSVCIAVYVNEKHWLVKGGFWFEIR